jgi:large repetitive protein
VAARSAGTNYYLNLGLDGSQVPGSSQIFNNHIPIDPQLAGTVAISKTTPLRDVTVGQLVPYVITVSNLASLQLTGVSVVDRMPPGFTYVKRSALLDGVPTEPTVTGRVLNWNNLTIATNQVRTLKLLLAVGAGVTQGEYVNRAQAVNNPSGTALSGEATAMVVVAPDPTFDCTDVFGKVFNDLNRNGVQDEGEPGLAGVRVVTPQGLVAKTDQFGRYHITCAIVPDETRGSNFVLKVDDRSLPSGFRMSTDPIEIKRATSGKALRINFGASIYRVVSIDLSDDAFEPGKTDIRTQWRPRTSLLLDELRKAPSVLRLSYIADTEDRALVEQRMQAFKRQLTEAWDAGKHDYVLSIEPEAFWRRGAPLKRPDVRVPESK